MEKEAFLKKLGEKIRQIRKGKKISQLKLAHLIGKDQQSIQRLEKGNINPTYFYLLEVAKGLEVDIMDLVDITELKELE
jgi:putative transcriptional regulator